MNKHQFALGAILLSALFILLSVARPADAARTGGGSVNYFAGNSDGYSTIYYNTGPVDVGSSASLAASLFVQGYSNVNIPDFGVASSTGQVIFSVGGPDSSATTTKIAQYSGFGTPTFSTSTGAGSISGTTTAASGSTDLAGGVYLVTGSAPAVNATILSVIFASSSPGFCVVSPMNAITAAGTASTTYVATTTNGFALKSNATGLTSTTTYQWAWHCN